MTAIKIEAETEDTITLNRQDWARLFDGTGRCRGSPCRAQSAGAREAASMGKDAIRQNALTGEEALRLLEGDSPVRVWRQKRGLTQRALAAAAGVAASYVAAIETGGKPGSADALSRLAGALRVSIDDLMDEQQRRRDPDYGPVYVRSQPYSAGIGNGTRGARPQEQRFTSVSDAWELVRGEWQTLRNRSPEIVDEQRLPIFGVEDLWREMEPELFDPHSEHGLNRASGSTRKLVGAEICHHMSCGHRWMANQSGCRVMEGVFLRECLDDPHAGTRDFPRLFQRHRPTFEQAFRTAIEQSRFSSWHDRGATNLRREIVLDTRDFHVLAGADDAMTSRGNLR